MSNTSGRLQTHEWRDDVTLWAGLVAALVVLSWVMGTYLYGWSQGILCQEQGKRETVRNTGMSNPLLEQIETGSETGSDEDSDGSETEETTDENSDMENQRAQASGEVASKLQRKEAHNAGITAQKQPSKPKILGKNARRRADKAEWKHKKTGENFQRMQNSKGLSQHSMVNPMHDSADSVEQESSDAED
jgi:flagellum-specific peptidoglycan hydrolase FlgJ